MKNLLDNVNYEFFNLEEYSEANKFFKIQRFDYIINLSSYVNHEGFDSNGIDIFYNQFKIIFNILKNTLKNKPKKFIQIGSSDEYGYESSHPNELDRESPFSPYSLGKLTATHLCMIFFREYNYPINIVRPFLIYGPFQNKNRLIPYIIDSCLKNKEFNIGNKNIERDFLYIDDFIDFIDEIILNNSVNGEIFNIGSGKSMKIEEIVNHIINITKKGKANFGRYKSGKHENMKLVANLEKVKKRLNWSQKIDIHNGLKKTIKSFQ